MFYSAFPIVGMEMLMSCFLLLSTDFDTCNAFMVSRHASSFVHKNDRAHVRVYGSITTPLTEKTFSSHGGSQNTDDLETIKHAFLKLQSGSDIRGQFVDHATDPLSIESAIEAMHHRPKGSPAPLTPLAAYCMGYSFAHYISESLSGNVPTICVGRDPRSHGVKLADQFCKGAKAFGAVVKNTGHATTPSMFEFCR